MLPSSSAVAAEGWWETPELGLKQAEIQNAGSASMCVNLGKPPIF